MPVVQVPGVLVPVAAVELVEPGVLVPVAAAVLVVLEPAVVVLVLVVRV